MKAIFAFVCVVILGASAHHLPPEEKLKLQKIHDSCQADPTTNVDERLLIKLPDNIDDPKVGAHMLCMSKKVGMQKESGDLDKDVVRSKIALVTHDQSKVDALLEKCAVTQDTPEKTAMLLCLCFVKNGIHYIHELQVQ